VGTLPNDIRFNSRSSRAVLACKFCARRTFNRAACVHDAAELDQPTQDTFWAREAR